MRQSIANDVALAMGYIVSRYMREALVSATSCGKLMRYEDVWRQYLHGALTFSC